MDDSTKAYLKFVHHTEQCSGWARNFVTQDPKAAMDFARALADCKTFEDFERKVEIDGTMDHFELLSSLVRTYVYGQLADVFQEMRDGKQDQNPNNSGE